MNLNPKARQGPAGAYEYLLKAHLLTLRLDLRPGRCLPLLGGLLSRSPFWWRYSPQGPTLDRGPYSSSPSWELLHLGCWAQRTDSWSFWHPLWGTTYVRARPEGGGQGWGRMNSVLTTWCELGSHWAWIFLCFTWIFQFSEPIDFLCCWNLLDLGFLSLKTKVLNEIVS